MRKTAKTFSILFTSVVSHHRKPTNRNVENMKNRFFKNSIFSGRTTLLIIKVVLNYFKTFPDELTIIFRAFIHFIWIQNYTGIPNLNLSFVSAFILFLFKFLKVKIIREYKMFLHLLSLTLTQEAHLYIKSTPKTTDNFLFFIWPMQK